MSRAWWPVVLSLVVACAPRPVLERAIAARGGPMAGLIRRSDVRVTMGEQGAWQWRTVAALPERYAWSIVTNDLPNHYLFDGSVVRGFVGSRAVSADASPEAALRTHARFAAVANLDVLRLPGILVRVTATSEPSGTRLDVVFTDRDDRYEVWLDADDLVRRVAGPIDLSPLARGRLLATYDDFARVAGRRIARQIRYQVDGNVLADEHVTSACVLVESPPATAFASPAGLPECPEARSPIQDSH